MEQGAEQEQGWGRGQSKYRDNCRGQSRSRGGAGAQQVQGWNRGTEQVQGWNRGQSRSRGGAAAGA